MTDEEFDVRLAAIAEKARKANVAPKLSAIANFAENCGEYELAALISKALMTAEEDDADENLEWKRNLS